MFVPGGVAPSPPVAYPVLDSGTSAAGIQKGTGGYSSNLVSSQITSVTPAVAGQVGVRMKVEAADSPSFAAPILHPADGVSLMTQIHLIDSYNSFLVVWTNLSGNNSQTPINTFPGAGSPGSYGEIGAWADSVYGVVAQQPWSVSATYNVQPQWNVGLGKWQVFAGPVNGPPTIVLNTTIYAPSNVPSLTNPGMVLVPPTVGQLKAKNAQQ
jgi:hypothetical protein